jgi:hypothetical protein
VLLHALLLGAKKQKIEYHEHQHDRQQLDHEVATAELSVDQSAVHVMLFPGREF